MEVIFLWQAARSFLCARQNQSLAGSENRHAANPTREVSNASVMAYLRKEKILAIFFLLSRHGEAAAPEPSWQSCWGTASVQPLEAILAPEAALGPRHLSVVCSQLFLLATSSQPCCEEKGRSGSSSFTFSVVYMKRCVE